MKSNRLIHSIFGAALSATILFSTASSRAADDFVNGDVSVSFYQLIGGVVQANTYVFNLGQGSLYRENTANNVSISTVNPAIASNNINTSLTAAFGSEWATSGTVYWCVAGTVEIFQSPINGDPQLTTYLSAPRSSLAAGALGKGTTFTNISSTNRGIVANNIVPFLQSGTNYGIAQTNSNTFIPVTGGNASGVVLPTSNIQSLEEYLPPTTGTKFGIGNECRQLLPVATIPGGAGVKGALDMYRVIHETTGADLTAGAATGNAVVGQGQFIGTLTLDSSGNLKIQALGAAAGTYATWATTKGIAGQPASGDFDFDGLTNLVEYGLGTDPKVSSQPAGTFSGGMVSFTKGSVAIANGDVDFAIEESDDLGITDPWQSMVTQNAPNTSPAISYMLPQGAPKKFARLKVTQKP
jgi:hypothetical protein